MLNGPAPVLPSLDPGYIALIAISVIGAAFTVLRYIFSGLADVVEAYYDFRRKCIAARERLRQTLEERARDTS